MIIENGKLERVYNRDIVNGSFEIPEGVTVIGRNAFEGCSNLTSIEIPEGVSSIERDAFADCTNLKNIKIPKGVVDIGSRAFIRCSNLVSIEIPEGVTKIWNATFYGCKNLTSITIPKGVNFIGRSAFSSCESLTTIKIPDTVTIIEENVFSECKNLMSIEIPESELELGVFRGCNKFMKIILPQNATEKFREKAYERASILTEGQAEEILFDQDNDKIKKIKAKANFQHTADYDRRQMDVFYLRMLNSIGIEEIERMVEIPNLTPEEIRKYELEKDEAFQELFNTKYKITGDLGVTLKLLKQLKPAKNESEETDKNNFEIKLFKELNKRLEQGHNGTLTELISNIMQEQQMHINPEFLDRIKDVEISANKALIKENLAKVGTKIEEVLGTSSEQYPDPIVPMQIEPVKAMIEDTITNIFKEYGQINSEILKTKLQEKLESAGAQYIVQRSEQIVNRVLGVFADDEFSKTINHSCMDALKSTKQSIGGAWKYKINQSLKQVGYTFDSLPDTLSKEEINKLSELLENEQLKIQSIPIAVPKEGIERENAYKLLEGKGHPDIITYKQIHDMFGSVREPHSEEFKKFFKKNRKEFLQNPRYYDRFGQIHNNFEMIINSPELKNTYEKGELTLEAIYGFLEKISYRNQRPGDEELAKLAKSVGGISTDKQFAHVQKIFDITRNRERTTIPPVIVTKSKYRGRMLSPDDVLNLFAGNITTCCQKFGDIGEGSMLLGSIEENGGIFVIEELDENGKVKNIIGQSLTIRQKGVEGAYDRLTFDNIEISRAAKLSDQDQKQILEIYQQAAEQAIEKDKKFLGKLLGQGKITQKQYDRLVLKEVIAGTGYNDLRGLKDLEVAEVIVPDEAYFKYKTISKSIIYPWIDSAGGKVPLGSKDMPVILAQMNERDVLEIQERNREETKTEVSLRDVPLWYGRTGKVQHLSGQMISEDSINQMKQIEKMVYRTEQQIMNANNLMTVEDIEKAYGITNPQIKMGSNKDWYLIYEENKRSIIISDLAVIGGLNSERNNDKNNSLSKGNSKTAVVEACNELYDLLIKSATQGKRIYCNATVDTSLVNITRMLRKGLIKVGTMRGKPIQYVKGIGLVYADNGELVETRNWDSRGNIQMLDLKIIPNLEKLIEEKGKIESLLQRAQYMDRTTGTEKEKGLDEMRRQIREEKCTNDDR